MRAYADSSFLVSLYIPEAHRTPVAIAYMEKHREALPFTPQHRLEVRNAVRLLVWSGRITANDRSRALREMESDLDAELFLSHVPLNYTHTYRRAERIGAAHSEAVGCRSSDLFHVAVAVELGFKNLLTFDHKQRELAQRAGLKVEF